MRLLHFQLRHLLDIKLQTVKPDTAPASFRTHRSLWTETPYSAAFRFTSTFDIYPQIAENKQWRHNRGWLYLVVKLKFQINIYFILIQYFYKNKLQVVVMTQTVGSYESSVNLYQTTRRYTPEDSNHLLHLRNVCYFTWTWCEFDRASLWNMWNKSQLDATEWF